MSTPTEPDRHFFIQPWRHAFFLGFFVAAPLLLGVTFELAMGQESHGVAIATAGIFILIGLPFYFLLFWYQRLILSADGIRHRMFGGNILTRWSDVEGFYRGLGTHSGLVTRAPVTITGMAALPVYRRPYYMFGYNFDDTEYGWLRDRRYLPLYAFAHTVRSGALQQAVSRWLPALAGLDTRAPVVHVTGAAASRTP